MIKFIKDIIWERLFNGLVKENPTLVMMLGLCPALAVTATALSGLGMGLTTLIVLALSNLCISLLRKVTPERYRIPVYIIIIATFVTIAEVLIRAFFPNLAEALGIYLSLIVVNCIVMCRVCEYASKSKALLSLFDGIGMGLGFTLALILIGSIREVIGAGELFGFSILPQSYAAGKIFILAPGAFFVMAALAAVSNKVKAVNKSKGLEVLAAKALDECQDEPAGKGDEND